MFNALRQELIEPRTTWGKRYTVLLVLTISASIFFLFVEEQYPNLFPLGSVQLLLIEIFILLIFSIDFLLRLSVTDMRDWRSMVFLISDGLAIIPSLWIVLHYMGVMDSIDLNILALLRLFRLLRVVKLLRVSDVLLDVFGASVLTLVFGCMAIHLGLRVLVMEMSTLLNFDILSIFDTDTLMLAVTAVGSIMGIAMAITFGIVKRKQIEISELHRSALDSLSAFERDIDQHDLGECKVESMGFGAWRENLDKYLVEEYSYVDMKNQTNVLLGEIRQATKSRVGLDVPFHNGLVQYMSAFLTKTQVQFHPAFYQWLNRIANIYFLLVMLATPGITGVLVQLLVIYVFQGLIVVIDDMDHAVDKKVIIFNSKILPV